MHIARVCVAKSMDEMSLYMYSLWIGFTSLYARSTYWSLSVSYWENRKELLEKDL
jgi:hypothetical protein